MFFYSGTERLLAGINKQGQSAWFKRAFEGSACLLTTSLYNDPRAAEAPDASAPIRASMSLM